MTSKDDGQPIRSPRVEPYTLNEYNRKLPSSGALTVSRSRFVATLMELEKWKDAYFEQTGGRTPDEVREATQ